METKKLLSFALGAMMLCPAVRAEGHDFEDMARAFIGVGIKKGLQLAGAAGLGFVTFTGLRAAVRIPEEMRKSKLFDAENQKKLVKMEQLVKNGTWKKIEDNDNGIMNHPLINANVCCKYERVGDDVKSDPADYNCWIKYFDDHESVYVGRWYALSNTVPLSIFTAVVGACGYGALKLLKVALSAGKGEVSGGEMSGNVGDDLEFGHSQTPEEEFGN